MRRALLHTLIAAAAGAALATSSASAAAGDTPVGTAPTQPASTTTVPAPVQAGATLTSPQIAPAQPQSPGGNGGTSLGSGKKKHAASPKPAASDNSAGAVAVPGPIQTFSVPVIPSSTCAAAGVPPILIPIYQRAANAYDLGPQGPAVLAGINEVETAFGTNLNISSAGAQGWMQFMPSTWATYGVDANGDGVRDPYNPEDAIFAAARYLSAAGMPADTYGAIYAYNHADWYVAEVLANANCYAPAVGGTAMGGVSLAPQLQVLTCRSAPGTAKHVPSDYLNAFQSAAARYGLGRRGVWALAAIGRLESNFGRGMSRGQLRQTGPLGLDPTEWRHYAVDGDGDGHIRHADLADSASTLARLIWSRGSLRAGVFTHNQAEWYVQSVIAEANRMQGRCKIKYVDWSIALPAAASDYVSPFTLSTSLVTGRIDQGVDFAGTGPIVAIGDAKVLRIGAPGWPGGGGVLYQLTNGPLAGQVIFVYEGVDATVQPGQNVKAGEQIATFRPGGSIEIGLADTAGVPLSHASYYEGKVTQSGLEMFSLLQSLGV